jgi:copper oxidase (laccase) domain-containing protein
MTEKFGCKLENIKVELGPAICGNCYPVDQKTFDFFVSKTGIEQEFPNLDLKKVIFFRLQNIGISDSNITVFQICTKVDSRYFSYRRNNTTGRQISLIGMI